MSRLAIIGPNTVMDQAIEKLYELKVYHIVDHKKTDDLDIGSPLGKSADISEVLVKARALCSSLKIDPSMEKISQRAIDEEKGSMDRQRLDSVKKRVDSLSAALVKNNEELRLIREKMQKLKERKELLEKLYPLGLDFEAFSDYTSISYIVGMIDNVKIPQLKEELSRKTSRYKIYCSNYEGKLIVAAFFEAAKRQDIYDVLAKKGLSEIDVSALKAMKGEMGSQLKTIRQDIAGIFRQERDAEQKIESMRKREKDFLVMNEKIMAEEAEKAEAPLRFGSTEKAFLIRGWVPTRKLDKTIKELENVTKERLYIEHKPAAKEDDIPIKLKNPFFVRPFEFFMDMYTLPTYKEIDPTFLMFLTFPLFYGFMLGDIGYGLVTLILFLYIRKKVGKDFGRLVNAMIFASISTIIFGVVFGEVFGLEKIGHYALIPLIRRAEEVNEMMYIAIAMGVVHINIGLLVGFYNELRAHGFRTAFLEKISWIIFEAGVAVTALTYMNYLPLQKWVGFTVIAASVVMIYLGEGPKGIVELPSIFSQTLSYTRLMAVGLASVILAAVVNDIAGELFHAGIVGIIGGIMLLVVGHAINITLGLISPFLHSLRLHYVEFFTKFYHGGGMRYAPFGMKEEQ